MFFSVPQFDRYGFRVVSLKREQDLVAKANALQQKSEEIKIKVRSGMIA